mmetsp:Transcript_29728/g.67032  ORF Transcript_29728/g.67032 Transcript_29728/m.67032 type:complete len:405 (+) Transcript_29728:814-2028(+)
MVMRVLRPRPTWRPSSRRTSRRPAIPPPPRAGRRRRRSTPTRVGRPECPRRRRGRSSTDCTSRERNTRPGAGSTTRWGFLSSRRSWTRRVPSSLPCLAPGTLAAQRPTAPSASASTERASTGANAAKSGRCRPRPSHSGRGSLRKWAPSRAVGGARWAFRRATLWIRLIEKLAESSAPSESWTTTKTAWRRTLTSAISRMAATWPTSLLTSASSESTKSGKPGRNSARTFKRIGGSTPSAPTSRRARQVGPKSCAPSVRAACHRSLPATPTTRSTMTITTCRRAALCSCHRRCSMFPARRPHPSGARSSPHTPRTLRQRQLRQLLPQRPARVYPRAGSLRARVGPALAKRKRSIPSRPIARRSTRRSTRCTPCTRCVPRAASARVASARAASARATPSLGMRRT